MPTLTLVLMIFSMNYYSALFLKAHRILPKNLADKSELECKLYVSMPLKMLEIRS